MARIFILLVFSAALLFAEDETNTNQVPASIVVMQSLVVPAWGAVSADHYGLAVVEGLFDIGCAYLILSSVNKTGESAMAGMFGIMGFGLNRLISTPLNGMVSLVQNTKSEVLPAQANSSPSQYASSSDLRAGFTLGFDGHVKLYLGSYWQWKTITLQARAIPWSEDIMIESDFADANLAGYSPRWEAELSKVIIQNRNWQLGLGSIFTRGTLEWSDVTRSSYSMIGITVSANYQAFSRSHIQGYLRYDFWASTKLPADITAGGQFLFLIW